MKLFLCLLSAAFAASLYTPTPFAAELQRSARQLVHISHDLESLRYDADEQELLLLLPSLSRSTF